MLNPLRDDVVLPNLNAPVGGTQSLQGTSSPWPRSNRRPSPRRHSPPACDFDYEVRTNDFAAVNAYYHNDRFFHLVADLGFPLATYFDGTTFPVEVDHRGIGISTTVNAHCDRRRRRHRPRCYGAGRSADTADPIGIACDWRGVLHELGGHGILYDHVKRRTSASRTARATLRDDPNDDLSEWHNGAAIDRFLLAPFMPAVDAAIGSHRRRGWGWGGTNDVGGYPSEQILSTTLFRRLPLHRRRLDAT